jgi:flagella basal body P-ring formation protein FlgA
MIRAIAFVTLLAAAADPAAAGISSAPAKVPTLKSAATVSGDLVRIGDLIDNAGATADKPIFRSPDLGTTGSVSVRQVLDAVRPYHMFLIDTGDIAAVEVTHAARTIEAAEIEASIQRAFAGRFGLGDATNIAMTLDIPARPVTIEASATGDLAVTAIAVDSRSNRFDITLTLPGGRGAPRTLRFTGTVVEMVTAIVTTRALTRGETIKVSDLMTERRPKGEVGPEGLADASDALGLSVRQGVRSGQPLRRTDLMKAELLHRDETVTLVYEVPGILITTQGKALESGSEGDLISVLNVQSKRTIQGVVTGPNRVSIMPATARVSSEAAAAAPRNVASR